MSAARGRTAAALVLAAAGLAWLDPHQSAREANRLYDAGKFDEAVTKYNEALVDQPDSALLHFNLGDAAYRQGKYDDALRAFGDVPARDADPARTARTAYNIGNAKYRLGQAAEASDPKAALGHYAEALVAYRRALGAVPDDQDAKFNHEFVEKKMAELRKRLEEEQKQKDEQKKKDEQQNQQDQQNQDQQKQDDQKQDQQNTDQQKQDQQQQEQQKQEQQQAGQDQQKKDEQQAQDQAQPQPKPEDQRQAAAGGGAGEKKEGEMSPEEAAALLDGQRGDEVSPEDIVKRLQRGGIAEPAEDW